MNQKTSVIWNTFSDYLRNFITQIVRSKHDVEDILQEVFLKIHLNISGLKNEQKLQSWIFSIARNSINDYHRKHHFSQEIKETDSIVEESDDEFEKLKDCLRPFIEKLPIKYKQPLYLSDIKGLKQDQIAQKLNLGLSATKSRIQRAREMLKQEFISCCNFSADEDGHLKGEHCH